MCQCLRKVIFCVCGVEWGPGINQTTFSTRQWPYRSSLIQKFVELSYFKVWKMENSNTKKKNTYFQDRILKSIIFRKNLIPQLCKSQAGDFWNASCHEFYWIKVELIIKEVEVFQNFIWEWEKLRESKKFQNIGLQ